jgi:hypothetical protein
MVPQQSHDGQQPRRTLKSWLRGVLMFLDRDVEDRCGCRGHLSVVTTSPRLVPASARPGNGPAATAQRQDPDRPVHGALLQFPIHGEALLVRLADVLRSRVVDRSCERDPLLLKMSRCPGSRLSIDRAAYVEFHTERSAYHVAIEAAPDTKVTLETTDFDTLVRFVMQYLTERRSEATTLEVAS